MYILIMFSHIWRKPIKNAFVNYLLEQRRGQSSWTGFAFLLFFGHVLKIFCYVFGFLFVIISSSRAWAHIFTYNKAHIKVHIILLGRSWLCFNLMKCTLSSHTLYAIYRNFIFSFGQFPGKIIVLLTNNLQK